MRKRHILKEFFLLLSATFLMACLTPTLKGKALKASSSTNVTTSVASLPLPTGKYRITDVPYFPNQLNNDATLVAVSLDGTFVLIQTNANNWGGVDGNGTYDLFAVDVVNHTVQLVSSDSAGTIGNLSSDQTGSVPLPLRRSFSRDNHKVIFTSLANNLVTGDTNAKKDCFVKNLLTGVTTRVNTDAVGTQSIPATTAECSAISADGNLVYFLTDATDLGVVDANGAGDTYVKNLTTGAISRATTNYLGAELNMGGRLVDLAEDDNQFLYTSFSTNNTAAADTNGVTDLFVKNISTGAVTAVSTKTGGAQAVGGACGRGYLSSTSNQVIFESPKTDLVPGDTNAAYDIFVKDLNTDTTTRISTDVTNSEITNQSLFVGITDWGSPGVFPFFWNNTNNLVAGDTNGSGDLFEKNTLTNALQMAFTAPGSIPPNVGVGGNSSIVALGGKFVYLSTSSTNITAGDTNGFIDVYLDVRP